MRQKTRVLNQTIGASLLFLALTAPAYAGQITGTAVKIEGLQNLAATVNEQSKGGIGKALGIIMGLGGLATLCVGRPGIGMAGIGGGIAMAFVPNIIGTAFDATQASTVLATLPQAMPAAPLQGMAYAALYPVLLAWRGLQDPVVLVCTGAAWALRTVRGGAHG